MNMELTVFLNVGVNVEMVPKRGREYGTDQ